MIIRFIYRLNHNIRVLAITYLNQSRRSTEPESQRASYGSNFGWSSLRGISINITNIVIHTTNVGNFLIIFKNIIPMKISFYCIIVYKIYHENIFLLQYKSVWAKHKATTHFYYRFYTWEPVSILYIVCTHYSMTKIHFYCRFCMQLSCHSENVFLLQYRRFVQNLKHKHIST